MQDFGRSQNKKQEKTVEIDLLSLVSITLIVLMGGFLLSSISRFTLSFISASKFEIVGETPYSVTDLMAGSEIKKGDKLYELDLDEKEALLLENCAYLKNVEIKTSFPNKIKFYVECYQPIWYIEISGDYYVLDDDLRVLEETKNKERLDNEGLKFLTLPNLKTAIVGQIAEFGGREEEIVQTNKIMETLLASRAGELICTANLANRYDIHLEFNKLIDPQNNGYNELDGVFKVSVGGYSKLDVKLEYIIRATLKEDLSGAVGGTIDISDNGDKISIRPIYGVSGGEEGAEESVG